jgi:serine phosphatase RsbU (regulator of sigma subunit)
LLEERAIQLQENVINYFSCNGCKEIWVDGIEIEKLEVDSIINKVLNPSDFSCLRCKNIFMDELDHSSHKELEFFQCRKCKGLKIHIGDLSPQQINNLHPENRNIHNFIAGVARIFKQKLDLKRVRRLPSYFKTKELKETNHKCPQCSTTLTLYAVSDPTKSTKAEFDICNSCHGIWIDKEDFRKSKKIPASRALFVDFQSVIPSTRSCPKCQNTKLVAMKFKGMETEIDCCPSCYGTWLDGGELHEFCNYLGKEDYDVINALIDNAIFQHPTLCRMLKNFSQTLHNLDSQIREQGENLEQAKEIQIKLLFKDEKPILTTPRCFGNYEVASFWQPAKTVGGDYFDLIHFELKGEKYLGICIADVSGKGLPASLLMANFQALLHSFAPTTASSSELCNRLNSILYNNTTANKYITVFYGILNLKTNTFTYTNAGHNPSVYLNRGVLIWLKEGGTVLGLFPDWKFEEKTIQLSKNDRILLYTDGVSESQNTVGDFFQEEPIARLFQNQQSKPIIEAQQNIIREVKEFCSGYFHDDATLLLLERRR